MGERAGSRGVVGKGGGPTERRRELERRCCVSMVQERVNDLRLRGELSSCDN